MRCEGCVLKAIKLCRLALTLRIRGAQRGWQPPPVAARLDPSQCSGRGRLSAGCPQPAAEQADRPGLSSSTRRGFLAFLCSGASHQPGRDFL